jgi:hypothetical protein
MPTPKLKRPRATAKHAPSHAPSHAPKSGAPLMLLSADEMRDAHNLIDEANVSNHALVEAGRAMHAARDALSLAEINLLAARSENRRIHGLLAPLLHRLPA